MPTGPFQLTPEVSGAHWEAGGRVRAGGHAGAGLDSHSLELQPWRQSLRTVLGWALPQGPVTPRRCTSFVSCSPGGGARTLQTCRLFWARGHLPSRPRAPTLFCPHPTGRGFLPNPGHLDLKKGLNLSCCFLLPPLWVVSIQRRCPSSLH